MKTIKILILFIVTMLTINISAQDIGKKLILNDINNNKQEHTIIEEQYENFYDIGIRFLLLSEINGKALLENISTINFLNPNLLIDNYINNDKNITAILKIQAVYVTDLEYVVFKCIYKGKISNKNNTNTYLIIDFKTNFVSIWRDMCINMNSSENCPDTYSVGYEIIKGDIKL